jgi:hypothetical protein
MTRSRVRAGCALPSLTAPLKSLTKPQLCELQKLEPPVALVSL